MHSYFDKLKEVVIQIKNCKTVEEIKNIEYPPPISTILKPQSSSRAAVVDEFIEAEKEHIHEGKHLAGKNESQDSKADSNIKEIEKESQGDCHLVEKVIKSQQLAPVCGKNESQDSKTDSNIKEIEKESQSDCHLVEKVLKSQQLSEDSTSKMPYICKKNYPVITVCDSQELLHTPIANRTFNILNTIVELNSIEKFNNDSNIVSGLNNVALIPNKSASKRTQKKEATSETSGNTQEVFLYTRSQSKRKSAECNSGSNKKQKFESYDVSATKGAKRKYPITGKTGVTKNTSAHKNKVSAVIVPTMQVKQIPVISKEKQILEEIKKKEDKANENRKRVLAERQMKAEETKKKREEKQEKILQKRLQLEKEKQQREMDLKKSPVKAATKLDKKPNMKTRVKALIEENTTKSRVLASSKPNECAGAVALPVTPANQKSFDSENYELTPMPDSSTYDFSDDEEDKPSGKPIPLWAQGLHLKSALVEQHYHPPDTDELFGTYIESPDLTELFGVQKKSYNLRTSSAIWNSPPRLFS